MAAGAARRRRAARELVGDLRRARPQCARSAGDRLEPDAAGRPGAVPPGARARAGRAGSRGAHGDCQRVGDARPTSRRTSRSAARRAETRYNDYILRGDVSYEFDLWGRVRQHGGGQPGPRRRRARRISRSSISACTPSWRWPTSSCAPSTPRSRFWTAASRRSNARSN